jgi:hypothetical protein
VYTRPATPSSPSGSSSSLWCESLASILYVATEASSLIVLFRYCCPYLTMGASCSFVFKSLAVLLCGTFRNTRVECFTRVSKVFHPSGSSTSSPRAASIVLHHCVAITVANDLTSTTPILISFLYPAPVFFLQLLESVFLNQISQFVVTAFYLVFKRLAINCGITHFLAPVQRLVYMTHSSPSFP